jgi:hypothetical protein
MFVWVERNASCARQPRHCIRRCLDGVGFALLRSGENYSRLMPYPSLPASLRGLLLIALCAILGACAGVPAQEMSDARQAIKAARDAGAEQVAPQKLNEAKSLLEQAEVNLQKGDYRNARRNAVEARGRATEALGAVQTDDHKGSG